MLPLPRLSLMATARSVLRNRLEAERQRKLLALRITGTEPAVEQADAAAKRADAQVMQSSAALEAAKRQLEVQQTKEAQLAAELKAAAAMLDLAQINLGYSPMAAWLGGLVFGPRRVRMISAAVLARRPR
jgi:membrane fusion protein (multidrug efflux system)